MTVSAAAILPYVTIPTESKRLILTDETATTITLASAIAGKRFVLLACKLFAPATTNLGFAGSVSGSLCGKIGYGSGAQNLILPAPVGRPGVDSFLTEARTAINETFQLLNSAGVAVNGTIDYFELDS